MNLISIKSEAQRVMLQRCSTDATEAARRGMTCELAKRSLDAHTAHALPDRLGPLRPNRHGKRQPWDVP